MFIVKQLIRNRRICALAVTLLIVAAVVHEAGLDDGDTSPGFLGRDHAEYKVFMRGMKGATGNLLFMFASLYGIARRNQRTPVMLLNGCSHLLTLFPKIRIRCIDSHSDVSGTEFLENAYGTYDKSLENLPAVNTILTGYYQSWKYFHEYAVDIRAQLTFRSRFIRPATDLIAAIPKKSCDRCGPTTYVGVHVRRGDRVNVRHFQKRYNVATASYLHKAMDYFRRRFPDVHFVVCSDSMAWCEQTLGGMDDVTFSRSLNAGIDMATLSLCNHTIFTVGTFGWWAAWLAGGMAVYFPDHVKVSTEIYAQVKAEDYFVPDWIAMKD